MHVRRDCLFFFFFQAEDGIRDLTVTGVQTCALPIYWRERPGTGTRVNSGGVNIIFSDSNTHHRGAENYRRSGEVDAMRLPKDSYFANQVMWDGWVDVERPRTDRKSTRLNSSHSQISYAVFCLKK